MAFIAGPTFTLSAGAILLAGAALRRPRPLL
ncbi:hypothetical protein JOD67_001403 [Tenggerimyces flavus]|nr:hypothetical protein [Tenggerimyces flavus]